MIPDQINNDNQIDEWCKKIDRPVYRVSFQSEDDIKMKILFLRSSKKMYPKDTIFIFEMDDLKDFEKV